MVTGLGSTVESIGSRDSLALIDPILFFGRSGRGTATEEVEGVYSHQTALSLCDLSDLNPAKLHMTVPSGFRRNSAVPKILQLHYADLPDVDAQIAQGLGFTRPLRTIMDLITEATVEPNIIRQSLRQAIERGLVTGEQVRTTQMDDPARKIVEAVFRRVA